MYPVSDDFSFCLTEGRHLQDTENRLRNNIIEQKSLSEAAMHADLDMKARQIEQKMGVGCNIHILSFFVQI